MWDFNAAKRRGLVKEIYLPLQWCVARVGVGCGLGNGLKNGMIAMKRGIKIALITLGSLVGLLLVLAIVLPVFFKPQLLRLAQQEISKRVEADVTIGDLHLSLFKAFPRLYVGLDDVAVVTRAPFAGDTLAAFSRFGVAVNVKTLFSPSNIEVYSLDLQRLRAYGHKDTLGRANWDVLPPADTTGSAAEKLEKTEDSVGVSLGLSLQRLNVSDAVLSYRDDSTRLFAEARDLDFTLRGDLAAKRSVLEMLLTIAKTTFEKGGDVMAPGVAVSLQAAVDADLENKRYTLGENELKLNDFGIKFSGVVEMPGDSIVTDLRFGTTRTDFKTLLSLVPAMYKRGLAEVQTAGELQLDGEVKGTMYEKELPSAKLALKVDRARFQYPALPKSVENIGIDLRVDFDGKEMDRTLIDLNRLHAEMAGNPVDVEAHVRTPMSDPSVRATVIGKVDLGAVREVVPLDSMALKGLLDLSVKLAARQSQVEKQQYEACELEGHVRLTDAEVEGVMPMVVKVPTLRLSLSPKQVRVEDLQVQAGRTDARIAGGLSDFLPYLMTKGTVRGDLQLRSKRVDLNELFPPSEEKKEAQPAVDTAASKPADLSSARRVTFAFNAQLDSLYFQNLRASDVKGRFLLEKGKLMLEEVSTKALGGSMLVTGDVDFGNEQVYNGDIKAALKNVSVQECVETFTTVEKLLSAAKYMKGTVSTDVTAAVRMSPSFDIDLKSLQADGDLRTSVLALDGVPTFEKLGALLKNDYISRPALEKVNIPFKVEDGNVIFSPFEFAVKGVKTKMGGRVGLDQTLDYTMSMLVPRSMLGKGAEALSQLEAKLPKGMSLGDMIPVGVRVSGEAKSPKVELTVAQDFGNQLQDFAKKKVEEVKQQVEEKVQEVKAKVQEGIDEAVAKAEAEAAKIKAQAQAAADKVLAEAQAQADRLVEEASKKGALAGMAAKKAADKMMKEARSKADAILAEADQKADALVAEAKEKSQL